MSPCLFRSLLLLSLETIIGKGGGAEVHEVQLMDLLIGLVDHP